MIQLKSIKRIGMALLPGLFFTLGGSRPQQQPGTEIPFINPSFEDATGASKFPGGWSLVTPGSTPDIMPGAWGLQEKPFDGYTCLGLVTREDGTCEDLGQMLGESLKSGVCYTFSIYLRHAGQYVGYNLPCRLRVWGGGGRGKKEILLASSPLIDHKEWTEQKLQFVPTKEVRFITFEAYYAPGALFKYKGNILLDKVSPIVRCNRA